MIKIQWADGKVMRDRSWRGLLRQIHQLPWNKDLSDPEFRKQLRNRAYLWSFIEIDTTGSARRVIEELARAGAIKIVEGGDTSG